MASPMTPERFQDRFEAFRGEPQQVSGVWTLHAAIQSLPGSEVVLDEQAPWALTFSQKPAADSIRAAQRKPAWPARSWQLPSSPGIPTCW